MAIDFFQYLEAHMHRIYGSAYGLIELAEFTLTERIQNGEMADMMTTREIQRKKWTGMRQLGPMDVESALQTLTEHNWVRPVEVKPDGAGRPTIRWEINPAGKIKKPRR
jgi:predicted transcriptional regulator